MSLGAAASGALVRSRDAQTALPQALLSARVAASILSLCRTGHSREAPAQRRSTLSEKAVSALLAVVAGEAKTRAEAFSEAVKHPALQSATPGCKTADALFEGRGRFSATAQLSSLRVALRASLIQEPELQQRLAEAPVASPPHSKKAAAQRQSGNSALVEARRRSEELKLSAQQSGFADEAPEARGERRGALRVKRGAGLKRRLVEQKKIREDDWAILSWPSWLRVHLQKPIAFEETLSKRRRRTGQGRRLRCSDEASPAAASLSCVWRAKTSREVRRSCCLRSRGRPEARHLD